MSPVPEYSLISSTTEAAQRICARAVREVQRNSAFRQARTCYDHLAGVAGVMLLDTLIHRHWLIIESMESVRLRYQLTPKGRTALQALGVDLQGVQSARRRFAYGCLDWTERQPHLAGALAAALLRVLEGANLLRREADSRTVMLHQSLAQWFDGAGRADRFYERDSFYRRAGGPPQACPVRSNGLIGHDWGA
jgi:hypothetical protein